MARKETNDQKRSPLIKKKDLCVSLHVSGLKRKEIAKRLGKSMPTINRWFREDHIKEQIAQKTAEIEQKNEADIIKKSEILEKLKDIMLLDPDDFHDENGKIKPLKDMPKAARMLLNEITERGTLVKNEDGSETWVNASRKIKWYSLIDAIKEINRMMPGFLAPQRGEWTGKDGEDLFKPADLSKDNREILKKIAVQVGLDAK